MLVTHSHLAMLTIRETFEFSMKCQADKNASEESRQTRVCLLLCIIPRICSYFLYIDSIASQAIGFEACREHSGGR